MGIENYFAFMATALLFVMAPGLDTVFVLNKSLAGGRRAGLYATLGINSGVLLHTFLGALGLSLLLAQYKPLFLGVKYLGAGYIIYMGLIKLREGALPIAASTLGVGSRRRYFWTGFATNALNPKVALFFLAFFPQFIDPGQLHSPTPFLALGLSYAVLGLAWLSVLVYAAGRFSAGLLQRPKTSLWLNRISGLFFMGMGIGLLFG